MYLHVLLCANTLEVKQSVCPSVVVGTKIARSHVLGICACCKHNHISEKLVYTHFELLKSCIFYSAWLWFVDHTHFLVYADATANAEAQSWTRKGNQGIKQLCHGVLQYYTTVVALQSAWGMCSTEL